MREVREYEPADHSDTDAKTEDFHEGNILPWGPVKFKGIFPDPLLVCGTVYSLLSRRALVMNWGAFLFIHRSGAK